MLLVIVIRSGKGYEIIIKEKPVKKRNIWIYKAPNMYSNYLSHDNFICPFLGVFSVALFFTNPPYNLVKNC